MSAPPFRGPEPGADPSAEGRRGRLGYAAIVLANDPDAAEALLGGLSVPRHRLDPKVLKAIGESAKGPRVVLTDELALQVAASGPFPKGEEPSKEKPSEGALEEPRPLAAAEGESRVEQDGAEAEPFEIRVYRARELCALSTPDEEPDLVGPFIRCGRITLLGATTGHGKTTLGAQMLARAVLGGDFLGWTVAGGLRVLVLDLEQHLEDIQEQLAAVGLADSEMLDYAPIPEGLAIDRDDEQRRELDRVVSVKPYDIVRVDPFYKLHAADSSEEKEARPLVALTRRWVNEHGFGLLIDTHRRKQGEGGRGFSTDDLFGSSVFARDPEIILGLELVEEGRSRLHVLKARGRRSGVRTGQKLDLLYSDDELFRRVPEEDERDLKAELRELGADYLWRTLKEWRVKPGADDADPAAGNYIALRGGIGASETKTRAALLELQREGAFDYAEGPPGRAKDSKCWRLREAALTDAGTADRKETPNGDVLW